MDKYKQLLYFSFKRLSSGFLIEDEEQMKTLRISAYENIHGAIAKIKVLLEKLELERKVEDDHNSST